MKKILVVIDMQNDFIDGSLGTKEAQEIVPKVIEKIKNFDGTVVYTRDTHSDGYLSTQEGKNLPVEHCLFWTHGWEIPEEIMEAGKEKSRYHLYTFYNKTSFGCPELAKDLCGIYEKDKSMSIELIGLCTDICVVSNALLFKAHMPEAEISVDASCCAGVTPETHEAALQTMRMCQIMVK